METKAAGAHRRVRSVARMGILLIFHALISAFEHFFFFSLARTQLPPEAITLITRRGRINTPPPPSPSLRINDPKGKINHRLSWIFFGGAEDGEGGVVVVDKKRFLYKHETNAPRAQKFRARFISGGLRA